MQAARRRRMATAATRIAHRRRQVLRLPSKKKKAKGKRKQDKQKKKKITVRATVSNRFVCTQKWNQPTIDFPAVTGKSVSRHSARPPETLVTSHLLTIVPIPFAQQRLTSTSQQAGGPHRVIRSAHFRNQITTRAQTIWLNRHPTKWAEKGERLE